MSDIVTHDKVEADTSLYSYHIDDDYYSWLVGVAREWNRVGEPVDLETRARVENVLFQEARLLDEGDFEQWLTLFSPQCAYWIPSAPDSMDPQFEITLEFHDLRRLTDRIVRIRTGVAYSQIPPSRTRRVLSNIEIWEVPIGKGEIRARANFVIHEFRGGISKTVPGWYGFVIVEESGQLKIALKQINLIDADYGQTNNSFFL